MHRSLLNRSPLLGQLFNFIDMASIPQKSATAAPKTPPPSQTSSAPLPDNDISALATSHTPATPILPPQDTKPRKRRRLNPITRPKPGSLYDIMHDHSGDSLFVPPICWTDKHAQLLDAHFVESNTIRKPVPDFNCMSYKYPPKPTKLATQISKELTTILSPKIVPFYSESIKSVMRTFFPGTLSKAKSEQELSLRCGSRIVKRAVHVSVLWKHIDSIGSSFDSAATKLASFPGRIPSSSFQPSESQTSDRTNIGSQLVASPPVLAFVNRNYLDAIRQNLYRVWPGPVNGDQLNTPVSNLQKLRSKRLMPATRGHDAYLVAVMVAIAQSQCYPHHSSKSSSKYSSQRSSQQSLKEALETQPRFRDVAVRILSQDIITAEFVVYSATVTADLLRRFDDLSWAPPRVDDIQDSELKIQVTRVPIWPLLGLKERLSQTLGEELSGEACSRLTDAEIETWESDEERELRLGSLKRKRIAVPDAHNKSFDSDGSDSTAQVFTSSANILSGLGITVASPPVSPRTPKRRRTAAQTASELEVF